MDDESTSLSLLDGLKAGDDSAWCRFVTIYGPVVYAKCRRCGMNEADSAELSQEIFLRVHKSIARFQRDGLGFRFRFWLNSVVKSAIVDHVRRLQKAPQVLGGSGFQAFVSNVPDLLDDESLSCDNTDAVIIMQQMLEVIEQDFSSQTWQAFWLTTIDGETASAAAERLSMKPNAVRQAKHRVMKRLEVELHGLFD